MYRDTRLEKFDAASVVEVVEHLDPPRLRAFERVLFEFARPGPVVLTTPNREFNVTWETLPAVKFRHPEHRFEWTRRDFRDWATGVAGRFGYSVRFLPVGQEHPECGPPTQMGCSPGLVVRRVNYRVHPSASLLDVRRGVCVRPLRGVRTWGGNDLRCRLELPGRAR
jgi:hypothetical protein